MGRARSTTAANEFIGMRIRERRVMRGLTQQELREMIGVNQRAYKYERGISSISAGRLYVIARELDVPLEYFFEGLEQNERQPHDQKLLREVMRNFGEVRNEKYLEVVGHLTRALAGR
jgi:transcriptional regulator with XRE-family HTH domain